MSKTNRTRRGGRGDARARDCQAHPAPATPLEHADTRPDAAPADPQAASEPPGHDPIASPPGRPAVGPITSALRAQAGERLGAWESTILHPADAEVRALRADLSEALGLVPAPVHAQTTDTAILPTLPHDAAPLTPPVPRGGPVGPAIPGSFRVEPLAAGPQPSPAAAFLGLPPIPVPAPPPPASVPMTAGLLQRIYGAPWEEAARQIRDEQIRFSAGRMATVHQSPTDSGAVAAAVLYGFSRQNLVWDGMRYVGGEPVHSRMAPAALMYALSLHVRDYAAENAAVEVEA